MIFVISPAKALDFETAPITDACTQPDCLDAAEELIGILRT